MEWYEYIIKHLDQVDDCSDAGLAFRAAYAGGDTPAAFPALRSAAVERHEDDQYALLIFPDGTWYSDVFEGEYRIGSPDMLDEMRAKF